MHHLPIAVAILSFKVATAKHHHYQSNPIDIHHRVHLSSKNPASLFASELVNTFSDPGQALLPSDGRWDYPWWEGGPVTEALVTYYAETGDSQYNNIIETTLLSQATEDNNFLQAECTGNDDQVWWALAALAAAESGMTSSYGMPFSHFARVVFEEQKRRWDWSSCGGGMKFKIKSSDVGYHYKSTIANGLLFQLAARIAMFENDSESQGWAEMIYDWTEGVGLISKDYAVFDGTDDASECVGINHDQWSYNVGVFMYGSVVMAALTGEAKWVERTRGFVQAAKRDFTRSSDGALWEPRCDPDYCNNDQVAFKGSLARWLGGTAVLMPELKPQIFAMISRTVPMVQALQTTNIEQLRPIDAFTSLEVMDALMRVRGSVRMWDDVGRTNTFKRLPL